MDVPRVDDICSTIGNVARVATVVELAEAVAACAAAEAGPLDCLLLDPHRKPASSRDHYENRQVLEAFLQFRWHLEAIRQESAAAAAAAAAAATETAAAEPIAGAAAAAIENPNPGSADDIERSICPPESYS